MNRAWMWMIFVLVSAFIASSALFAEEVENPVPLMKLDFNKPGTEEESTGSAKLPPLQLRDGNNNPFDLHTAGGEGISGQPDDRAYDPKLDPLKSGRATQVLDNEKIDGPALKKGFTIILSYNPESLSEQGSSFFHNSELKNGKRIAGYRLQGNFDGTFTLFVNDEEIVSSAGYPEFGKWITVIAVYDSSALEVRFYKCVDGVLTLVSTHKTSQSSVLNDRVPFSIGQSVRCKMDNVMLFSEGLTESQISTVLGCSTQPPPPPPPPEQDRLYVTETSPKDKEENVRVDLGGKGIRVTFNQNIRDESETGGLNSRHFTLKEITRDSIGQIVSYGPDIPGSYAVSGNVLVFNPVANLEYEREYMGFVMEPIRAANAAGTNCDPYNFSFKTETFVSPPPTPETTPSPEPTPEISPEPTVTPEPTIIPSPTSEPTPPPTPTPETTPSPEPTIIPSPTSEPTPTPIVSPVPSPVAKGAIFGKVISDIEDKPLKHVEVYLNGDDGFKQTTETDSGGNFELSELPEGKFSLRFTSTSEDYKDTFMSVKLATGEEKDLGSVILNRITLKVHVYHELRDESDTIIRIPIEDAHLSLKIKIKTTTGYRWKTIKAGDTNSNGFYGFTELAPGRYKLKCRAKGYEPAWKYVQMLDIDGDGKADEPDEQKEFFLISS